MHNISKLALGLALCLVAACGQGGVNVKKADSLVIDSGAGVLLVGEIKFGLGGLLGGGGMGQGEPAGPIIVYVFHGLSDADMAQMNAPDDVQVKNNAAYLWPEGIAYGPGALNGFKFIRDVDPKLSEEEIAALFKLKIN